MFEIIVVGADDSTAARRAVEAASDIAAIAGSELHIVTVSGKKLYDTRSFPHEFRGLDSDGEALALLQVLSFIPKKKNVEPVLHAVHGDPATAITRKAVALKADLVVVGNRGMKGARKFLGSVPNSIAHAAEFSVAIIDTSD